MSKQMIFILTFLSLYNLGFANWESLSAGTLNLPPHVYQILLKQNQTLNGVLTWDSRSVNLNVYLYKLAVDLFNDKMAIKYFNSTSSGKQNFTYLPDQDRVYYLRVHINSSLHDKLLRYQLKLKSSSIINQASYSGIFYKNFQSSLIIVIPNSLKYQKIAFKYSTNSSTQTQATLNFLDDSINLSQNQKNISCITASGVDSWILAVKSTANTNFKNISYNLQYNINYTNCKCPSNYSWNDKLLKCKQINLSDKTSLFTNQDNSSYYVSFSKTPLIVSSVLGAIFVIGIIVCCCRRCKRQKQMQKHKQLQRQYKLSFQQKNKDQRLQSQQNLTIIDAQICCICLTQDCNIRLACSHCFHRQCIKWWILRNYLCPLCRKSMINPLVLGNSYVK